MARPMGLLLLVVLTSAPFALQRWLAVAVDPRAEGADRAAEGGRGSGDLPVERAEPTILRERGQLPALELGSLRLRQWTAAAGRSPRRLRSAEIPEHHGLPPDPVERRLKLLQDVQATPFDFTTPRGAVRALVALNAASMEVMYRGMDALLEVWGTTVYEEETQAFYPKPSCHNVSDWPLPSFPGYDPNFDWVCPDSLSTSTTSTTTTLTTSTTTVSFPPTTLGPSAPYPAPGAHTIDFESGTPTSGGLVFSQMEGDTSAQPKSYELYNANVSHPSGGGTYFFYSDSHMRSYETNSFVLGPGDITFDFAGVGGVVSLCWTHICQSRRPQSQVMSAGKIGWTHVRSWLGREVRFSLSVDTALDFFAIDNIVYHQYDGIEPLPPTPISVAAVATPTVLPTHQPTTAPTYSSEMEEKRVRFEREVRYINETTKHLHERYGGRADATITKRFAGVRLPPCEESSESDERCIDDVGVSLSVYEDAETKVLVYQAGFHAEENYIKWASKINIIDQLGDQIKHQWAQAREPLTPEMAFRSGFNIDELATRCSFLNQEYKPVPDKMREFLPTGHIFSDQKLVEQKGLWPIVKQLTRMILPEGRNMGRERTKRVILTGSGLGGAFAALVTMWLMRVEAQVYEARIFTPVGFLCWAQAMYSTEMSTMEAMPSMFIYAHVLDAYSLLGSVKGNLCLYGTRRVTRNEAVYRHCEKIVGFTGAQLLFEGVTKVRQRTSEGEDWDAYLQRIAEARKEFYTCHYFTHSPWYAAQLLADPEVLSLEGTTDGGCHVVEGISSSDTWTCPSETVTSTDCSYELEMERDKPILVIMIVAITVFSLITCAASVVLGLYLSVDRKKWIYDLKRPVVPFYQTFCERWCPKRVFDHYFPSRKVRAEIDRPALARQRASARQEKKAMLARKKQLAFDMSTLEHGDPEEWKEDWWREMVQLVHSQEVVDVYVVIYGAQGLQHSKMSEMDAISTVCLCQIKGKKDSRIITPEFHSQDEGAEVIWDHCELLNEFVSGDDLEITVWDVKSGDKTPENGFLLGGVSMLGRDFFPHGKKKGSFVLYDTLMLPTKATVTVEVHCHHPDDDFPARLGRLLGPEGLGRLLGASGDEDAGTQI